MTTLPVLLLGQAFRERVTHFDALAAVGTISAADLEIFRFVESAREAWQIISQANGIAPPVQRGASADPAPGGQPD